MLFNLFNTTQCYIYFEPESFKYFTSKYYKLNVLYFNNLQIKIVNIIYIILKK